jgi:hypothetical protein
MTEAAKTEQEIAVEQAEAKASEVNASRTGKGTRVKVGSTRGRNPQVISFESFDESLPDTLPKDISQFMEITKVQDEPTIMGYLIDGFNLAQYTTASDPVAEFVDPSWDDDIKKNFRTVVRNYAAGAQVSIEDAANLIKPAYLASQAKK